MKCEGELHRWVSGDAQSDWVCDECGERANIGEFEPFFTGGVSLDDDRRADQAT
jgi:hypothetical protein